MKTLSLSEAKMKLSALVDRLSVTNEEIMITRNGSPAAILISPEDYESWKETLVIRSDTELMEEIRKGLSNLKDRKAKVYTLEEL